ncbi:MAG TPA: bifunctional nuclease family protein [Acidimicrobiia bacterium]|nr:bifunctional nuclease family protein [Acidimicrobiia bacterium]
MKADVIAMTVVGVRVELPSNTPIVLLREQEGNRYLPIWIGAPEATAIATAMENVEPPRPLTHDLLMLVIEKLSATVSRVVVSEMKDSVFYADLVLTTPEGEVHISARPSDSIALAVRSDAPVFAHPSVLDEAGIEIEDESEEQQIERFREFLEDVTVEDFMEGEEPPGSEPD